MSVNVHPPPSLSLSLSLSYHTRGWDIPILQVHVYAICHIYKAPYIFENSKCVCVYTWLMLMVMSIPQRSGPVYAMYM